MFKNEDKWAKGLGGVLIVILAVFVYSIAAPSSKNSTSSSSQTQTVTTSTAGVPMATTPTTVKSTPPIKDVDKTPVLLRDFDAINPNDTMSHVRHLIGKRPTSVERFPPINATDQEYIGTDHDKLEIGFVGKTVNMVGYIPKSGPELTKPTTSDSTQQTAVQPSPTNSQAYLADYNAINVGDSQSSVTQTMGRAPDYTYQTTDGSDATALCYKDSDSGVFNELRVFISGGIVTRVSYFPEDGPVTNSQTKP